MQLFQYHLVIFFNITHNFHFSVSIFYWFKEIQLDNFILFTFFQLHWVYFIQIWFKFILSLINTRNSVTLNMFQIFDQSFTHFFHTESKSLLILWNNFTHHLFNLFFRWKFWCSRYFKTINLTISCFLLSYIKISLQLLV